MADKLIYGDRIFADNNRVVGGSAVLGVSLSGGELTIDTLEEAVNSTDAIAFLRSDSSGTLIADSSETLIAARPRMTSLLDYNYGDVITRWHDDVLLAKMYLTNVRRISSRRYALSAASAMGMLKNDKHYGGMYDGDALSDVLADVMGSGVAYMLDAQYADIPVYGHLRIASRRNNLHELIFPLGLYIRKTAAGDLWITTLDVADPDVIPDSRVWAGGIMELPTDATIISVTEHSFGAFVADELRTLYSGEVDAEAMITPRGMSVTGALVTFADPIHDLEIDGGEIIESGVNYAVLERASDCTLTGRVYTHTTRELRRRISDRGVDSVLPFDRSRIVSPINSERVIERVAAYYAAPKILRSDIKLTSERPGQAVTLSDPAGDVVTAVIERTNITLSGVLRADTRLVQDFAPVAPGNYYTRADAFATAGAFSYTVPATCCGKVKIAIGGGGQAGQNGTDGTAGGVGSASTFGAPGAGGAAGAPGAGGNVYVITIDAKPGDLLTGVIGTGGLPGVGASTLGGLGTDTTLGAYSSAQGRPSNTGYIDLIHGTVYGSPGDEQGTKGSDGGGDPGNGNGASATGPDGTIYAGGAVGAHYYDPQTAEIWAGGGCGGGAAIGSNGTNGTNATNATVMGGNGGNGGNASARAAQAKPGKGGAGGHGGGGGGGSGGSKSSGVAYQGTPGAGGAAGIAGKGGDGWAVILS